MPRREAMAWLRTLEPFERGNYAAPIGWIDSAGDAELRVAIRCGHAQGRRLDLTAGAGLVRGSIAENCEDTWTGSVRHPQIESAPLASSRHNQWVDTCRPRPGAYPLTAHLHAPVKVRTRSLTVQNKQRRPRPMDSGGPGRSGPRPISGRGNASHQQWLQEAPSTSTHSESICLLYTSPSPRDS